MIKIVGIMLVLKVIKLMIRNLSKSKVIENQRKTRRVVVVTLKIRVRIKSPNRRVAKT